MKDVLIVGILAVVSYFGIAISSIWTIVEFLIYLVKDTPFNWMSMYCFISSVVLLIGCAVSVPIIAAYKKR